MSTVITRIMHQLRVGNEAGRITTDDRGANVWEWNESDEAHGSTTAMIRRLDNNELQLVGAPDFKLSEGKQAEGSSPEPALCVDDDRIANKFGKKVDGNGGFNPYG